MPANKKPSPAKAAAARANGKKSAGPKTAAGKQKSSRNSIKHGATCSTRTPLLLPGEDAAKLQLYTDAFYHHFCPKNLAEAALVDTLIAEIWRSARITGFESEILTAEAEDLHPTLSEQYESVSLTRLFALTFRQSAAQSAVPLLLRYLSASRNMFRSALTDLIRLRQAQGTPEPTDIQPPKIEPLIRFCTPSEDPEPFQPDPESDPQPVAEPELHLDPEPQPQPEPVVHFQPEPEPAAKSEPEPELSYVEPPMIPHRDELGRIVLNGAGMPIMIPNIRYQPKPGEPSFIPEYDVYDFPGERFNIKLVRDLELRFNAEGYLRNEPT